MREKEESQYVKRTQRDYSYAFKLQVVSEVESGEIGIKAAQLKYGIQGDGTISRWIEKFGNLDWENKSTKAMSKSPEQKLMELEAKVKLLEKQKASLEKRLDFSDRKVIFFDMMIDVAEEEFKIPIRKKHLPEQSTDTKSNEKKA
jgi:transposase-like protein